jgi:hypothetical protein
MSDEPQGGIKFRRRGSPAHHQRSRDCLPFAVSSETLHTSAGPRLGRPGPQSPQLQTWESAAGSIQLGPSRDIQRRFSCLPVDPLYNPIFASCPDSGVSHWIVLGGTHDHATVSSSSVAPVTSPHWHPLPTLLTNKIFMINLFDGVTAEVGSGDRPDRERKHARYARPRRWAAAAVAVFQSRRTGDEHAIANLICDLGHLVELPGLIISMRFAGDRTLVRRATCEGDILGPDAAVEITGEPRWPRRAP